MATPGLMVIVFGAFALMVGAIASLALGSWWILLGVLAVHALVSAVVIGYAFRQAGQSQDKPDPVMEARIEEEIKEVERPSEADEDDRPRDREVFS